MKIGEKTFVSLNYVLKVNGEIVDQSSPERPLEFVVGMGMLLPKFEENIAGKVAGDKFEFTLTPEEGYGVQMAEAIVELPKTSFMIDGKIEEGLLEVGNQIPMATSDGQRMIGNVTAVSEETVTMDFNHPMAGKTLDFTGEVLAVREATDADMAPFMGGGCGCGGDHDGCGEGCGEENDGCGCGCH